MKATLQILMLVLGAGCAVAAFAGVTGIAPITAFATSDVAMLLYSMVGALLIGFNDYSRPRLIALRVHRHCPAA